MIKQTVLKFKLASPDEHLTSHAGRALSGEFAIGAGIRKDLDTYFPRPGSGKGYLASEHVYPLLLMLTGGGRALEDLREIREDWGLREILGLKRIPSADAIGDWLRRSGSSGCLEGLERVNHQLLKGALKRDGNRTYTNPKVEPDPVGLPSIPFPLGENRFSLRLVCFMFFFFTFAFHFLLYLHSPQPCSLQTSASCHAVI